MSSISPAQHHSRLTWIISIMIWVVNLCVFLAAGAEFLKVRKLVHWWTILRWNSQWPLCVLGFGLARSRFFRNQKASCIAAASYSTLLSCSLPDSYNCIGAEQVMHTDEEVKFRQGLQVYTHHASTMQSSTYLQIIVGGQRSTLPSHLPVMVRWAACKLLFYIF